jgi:hypothetical protein
MLISLDENNATNDEGRLVSRGGLSSTARKELCLLRKTPNAAGHAENETAEISRILDGFQAAHRQHA